MKLAIVPVTAFQQNCSLVVCEETNAAALVDPGGDVDRLLEVVAKSGAKLVKVLVTHGHVDHCGGAAEIAARTGVPVVGPHADDDFLLQNLTVQGGNYGIADARNYTPDQWLKGGDSVEVGNIRLDVRHCPGHTPGHVVFVEPNLKLAFVGDVLFQGSIGRTDFPRGDHATLIASITRELWPLGDDVQFVPGHGPMSTFGEERRSNPFVGDAVLGR